ncbi:glyoxylate reductase/hydroxypyruvate reductase-like [Scylla paramamosain]|uniref:glyoxylate reductase/hydroxypyruvate reductase-like n=1 Tax=Scylla paramamosain TaxID=85552 RepID=UPI003083A149
MLQQAPATVTGRSVNTIVVVVVVEGRLQFIAGACHGNRQECEYYYQVYFTSILRVQDNIAVQLVFLRLITAVWAAFGVWQREEFEAEFVSFDELLRQSDFLLVTCALNKKTQGIFDEAAFAKMKNTAVIFNTSQGDKRCDQQEALVKALKTNQIRAAGLDVMTPELLTPDHKLTTLPNCTLIPHIGSAETSTREDMATLTAANIIAGLERKPLPGRLC